MNDITLVLRPCANWAGGGDAGQRLRRLLKSMLRAYGFRCVRMAEARECVQEAAGGVDAKKVDGSRLDGSERGPDAPGRP